MMTTFSGMRALLDKSLEGLWNYRIVAGGGKRSTLWSRRQAFRLGSVRFRRRPRRTGREAGRFAVSSPQAANSQIDNRAAHNAAQQNQAAPPQPGLQQFQALAEIVAKQGHGRGPDEGAGDVGGEEARPVHAGRAGRHGADHANACDEALDKDCPEPEALQIVFRQLQRPGSQEEKSPSALQEPARKTMPEPEAHIVADHRG